MERPDAALSLTAAREFANLTQEALAAKLGLTRGAVSQWETGETSPTGPARRLLALIFNVEQHVVDSWFERERASA